MAKRKMTKQDMLEVAAAQNTPRQEDKDELSVSMGQQTGEVSSKSHRIKTVDALLAAADVDLNVWEVERQQVNKWEVAMKDVEENIMYSGDKKTGNRIRHRGAHVEPLWQVKVWLKRKTPQIIAAESILAEMREHSPVIPKIKRTPIAHGKPRRMLEVSILDPHMGLRCHQPASDHYWDIETCETTVMDCIERLIESAQAHAPFEQILMPFGNDFVHADNVFHTTTAGTGQPEMESWQHVYVRAQKLALAMVDRLKQEAPIRILVVPGNHARQTEYTLGCVIEAYFRNDKNVSIDASASPYKFHHYGVNLIGFEHGHSVRPQIRLAALMANECRDVWSETVYREWHLGDQHRKGSGKPSVMEEQGVSVEFLPGLTAPNEWHKIKSYNWQKRGGMAFVWDKVAGPVARLQVNIDSYTGRIM